MPAMLSAVYYWRRKARPFFLSFIFRQKTRATLTSVANANDVREVSESFVAVVALAAAEEDLRVFLHGDTLLPKIWQQACVTTVFRTQRRHPRVKLQTEELDLSGLDLEVYFSIWTPTPQEHGNICRAGNWTRTHFGTCCWFKHKCCRTANSSSSGLSWAISPNRLFTTIVWSSFTKERLRPPKKHTNYGLLCFWLWGNVFCILNTLP